MEYATNLCNSGINDLANTYPELPNQNICDDNFMRYVGWEENNFCIREYFSKNTVKTISLKVTELTLGVDPQNRPIVVPDAMICNVMSQIYQAFRPAVGSIYSRYTIPSGEPENYVQDMIDQVIEIIVSDIRNNLELEECNSKLTAWTTVLGDFNTKGLRSHSKIKVREKNTNFRGLVSFMNY
jgi:hypothetical protein